MGRQVTSCGETIWTAGASVRQRVRTSVTALSFWSAVVLPFLYFPLLATGLDTVTQTTAFLVLLALNLVSVLLGHSYHAD